MIIEEVNKMTKIQQIFFPNTVIEDANANRYKIGMNCAEIKLIKKNGEMAEVNWLQIIKDNKVIAEIKESICNVYYN